MELKTIRTCLSSGIHYSNITENSIQPTHLTCLGFCGATIDYLSELSNMACDARELAYLSRGFGGILTAGVYTELYGEKRKSVAVFNNGKLLNISDMINTSGTQFSGGCQYNIYRTEIGKIGVVVDADIYAKPVAALAVADCSLIIVAIDATYTSGLELILKCEAYQNCPIFCTTHDISVIISPLGNIMHESAGITYLTY